MTAHEVAEKRFWAKVDKSSNCWIWKGSKNLQGYGCFRWKDENSAHRVSYRFVRSEIPEGATIDHLCRNPSCVNPSHLEAVSLKENILRGFGPPAINARKKFCVRGHEFNDKNTRIKNGTERQCRACHNIRYKTETPQQRILRLIRARRSDTKRRLAIRSRSAETGKEGL